MKLVFISAGHGGADPGATANGVQEAAIALEFRDLVAHYLEADGVSFSTDGRKGENLPLRDAIKLMPKDGVCVEFHLNAGPSTATGVETLSAARHFGFGQKLCAAIASRLGIRNRGAKAEDSGQHSKLAFVQAGGVIIELFFVSNSDDLKAYQSVKWLLARDVADLLISEAQA